MGKRQRIIKKKRIRWKAVMLVILLVILLAGAGIYYGFRITDLEYVGSEHYSDEQLNSILFHNKTPNALLYKLFGYSDEDIPFIQKCDVEIQWPNKMTVTVYEKAIVGYIKYLGCNMYFDKDGVVVESSSEDYEDVPEISGLKFSQIVLNSKLDVGNDDIYNNILEMTQAFDKYDLSVDKVYFDSSYDVTLYMGNIKVLIGDSTDCTDKLYELNQIIGKLDGYSGTLHLENYDGDSTSVIFKLDESE